MLNLRPFQIILLASFAFLAIASIVLINLYKPASSEQKLVYGEQVVVWGTLDPSAVSEVKNQISNDIPEFSAVKYQYIDERVFDEELTSAIAEGRSPDLIMLRSDALVKHRAKLVALPYETVSRNAFRDTYVDGAEIFMMSNGIYALPFAVDPLVMYWNRDLFASGGVAEPPSTWENLVGTVVPSLTIRDTSRNIIQSAVALGEFRNIENAKAIILALTMQSGSKMVTEDEGGYEVELDRSIAEGGRSPMEAAMQFYADFSSPSSPLYTWNRAQPSDKNAFVSEDLAVYFGRGSEAEDIADKNPNLNFDVATMPQGASATIKRTYGDFYGFAIPNASANKQGAYAAALQLSAEKYSRMLGGALNMASPRRSVISAGDQSPYRQRMLESALIARSWLDPDTKASEDIFATMVEDVVSNRERVGNAVVDAIRKLVYEY